MQNLLLPLGNWLGLPPAEALVLPHAIVPEPAAPRAER